MKRILCPELPTRFKPASLEEGEAHHALKVLRLKDGDEVEAMDGKGGLVRAILRLRNGKPVLELRELNEHSSTRSPPEMHSFPVILEAAVLKGDAMEWMIEKAVELGVAEIVPLLTAHTVVQVGGKGPEAFQNRWQKIADQALKQCGRTHALRVHAPIELSQRLAEAPSGKSLTRLWANEAARHDAVPLLKWIESPPPGSLKTISLLTGPEGGWSAKEVELLSHELKISLGPWVLRAETAALLGAGILVAASRRLT